MLTEFRGIQELGYIAGLAIMLSWLAMMTVFPAVLVLVDRRHALRPRDHKQRAPELELALHTHGEVLDAPDQIQVAGVAERVLDQLGASRE